MATRLRDTLMATPHLCLDEGVALPDEENFQGTEPEGPPKPKEIEKNTTDDSDDEEENGLVKSLTARRFNRSMRNVIKISKFYRSQVALRGVMRAKSRFLQLIKKTPTKEADKVTIDDEQIGVKTPVSPVSVVESEWQRLARKPPIFKITNDIDFSDLAKYIIEKKTGQRLSRLSVAIDSAVSNNAPPPPPPPLTSAPPPPPPSMAPNIKGEGGSPVARKIRPIHVKQVYVKPNQETIWSGLPVIKADLSDLQKLFEVTSNSKGSDSVTSDSQSLARSFSVSAGPLSVTESTDVLIMFRKLPKKDLLLSALKTMDNTKVSRENLDKLLDFVTKEKYIGWMEKVKTFAKNEPTHPLNEAEAFLLMLSTTEGLIDSLKLWQIKEDCEEMEREICQPLFNIKTSMDMIKASKELALILNTTLQVVNFLKNTQYKAVSIEDLKKLDDIKDITNERSLLFHIVRKLLDSVPDFSGFPENLLDTLREMASVNLEELDQKIEVVEKGYRDPLGYLIEQNVLESAGEGNFFKTLREFMYTQIEKMHTVKKVKVVILEPYKELLLWLCIADKSIRPQEFGNVILEFCTSVNKAVEELNP